MYILDNGKMVSLTDMEKYLILTKIITIKDILKQVYLLIMEFFSLKIFNIMEWHKGRENILKEE
jgi:hypothetical protein